jgi:hypothetical protein
MADDACHRIFRPIFRRPEVTGYLYDVDSLGDCIAPIRDWLGQENAKRQANGRNALSVVVREEQGEYVFRDFEDLLRITQATNDRFGLAAWYRGHLDATWNLVPAVYRTEQSTRQEANMCCAFMIQGPARQKDCPSERDRLAWLSLMRHYGLPTRLLDWTQSVLIAAYFAVCEDRDCDSAIWALCPWKLNEASVGKSVLLGPYTPEVMRGALAAFDREVPAQHSAPLAVLPAQIDQRLMLQHSCFTLHPNGDPLESVQGNERFLSKFVIPRKYRKGFRIALECVGIRKSLLFPDLGTLAETIRTSRCAGGLA